MLLHQLAFIMHNARTNCNAWACAQARANSQSEISSTSWTEICKSIRQVQAKTATSERTPASRLLVSLPAMSRNEVEWENGICSCFNDCSLCKPQTAGRVRLCICYNMCAHSCTAYITRDRQPSAAAKSTACRAAQL